MISVRKRFYDSGNFAWYAYFTVNKKRYRIKLSARNKAQAEQLANIEYDKVVNQENGIKVKVKLTLDQLCEQYLEYAKVNKKSWDRDELSIRNITNMLIDNKRLGDWNINEIKVAVVQKYQIRRKRELDERFDKRGISEANRNYATINRELDCLRHIFYLGIDWEIVSQNPVKSKAIKREREIQRDRILSKTEIKRILQQEDSYTKQMVITALNTGMRSGEIRNLKWINVNLENRTILVTQTKTDQNRTIPINDFLLETLERINKLGEYVWGHEDGHPFGSVKKSFATLLRRSGIKNFRFHDLRHTAASYMSMGGIQENIIAEILGHSKRTMTSRYSHANWEAKKLAVKKLSNLCHACVTQEDGMDKEKINDEVISMV